MNDSFAEYKKIILDCRDLSGSRQAKVVVDIDFGYRTYRVFTNEHGQLVRVIVKKIILQDDAVERLISKRQLVQERQSG